MKRQQSPPVRDTGAKRARCDYLVAALSTAHPSTPDGLGESVYPSVQCAPGSLFVTALDMLIAGVHFPHSASATDIAYKAIAVNLSDLAAMGAKPAGVGLAVTIGDADTAWLDAFAGGLRDCLAQFSLDLNALCVDDGPLSVSVQASGTVTQGRALTRAGAAPGDLVLVSGALGDARLGLEIALAREVLATDALPKDPAEPVLDGTAEQLQFALGRLHRPSPRVALGQALAGLASAAIDVSDGLVQDLGHILACSGVGATIHADRLPLSDAMRACKSTQTAWHYALTGGDDYELCVTMPSNCADEAFARATGVGCPLTCIGQLRAAPGLNIVTPDGNMPTAQGGYDHFR